MITEWLTPLLEWLGIGFIPFLLLVLIIIIVIKD